MTECMCWRCQRGRRIGRWSSEVNGDQTNRFAGVRGAVLDAAGAWGSTVFDKAWERLTAHHEIVIKK